MSPGGRAARQPWLTGPRIVLTLACGAVAFAAADTYVIVLALPDMMTSVGLGIDQLQRAAPIVSGFLLGYVAMLPLLGRVADLRGRIPVLVGSLVVFAVGSLVTASAFDLASVVSGRFLQGVGGGGLVPATLALVADLWPADRRGLPLGVVGAVQELGSVIGPLYGALVLAIGSWRLIFWLNVVLALMLAVAIRFVPGDPRGDREGARDPIGLCLGLLALGALAMLMLAPDAITSDVTWGRVYVPYTGDSRWLTPLALVVLALGVLFAVRALTASRPLVDLRGLPRLARQADVVGAMLLGLTLAGIVVAFATADPQVQVFSPAGPWLLAGSVVAAALFALRQRSAKDPLVPRGSLTARPAWGSLVVSFFVGAALIAALVDVPVFARVTVYPDSQLGAALVLVRFLIALPIGALLGGLLTRTLSPGLLTAVGMTAAAVGFGFMTQWGMHSMNDPAATVVLVLAGLGFGLAIAPVNAALLASTADAVHGIASALLVVSRMIGMLVGVSALTTIGLRHFFAVSADLPTPQELCGSNIRCQAYDDAVTEAGLAQMHGIFLGAAVCAAVAGGLALLLYRGVPRTGVRPGDLLHIAG